MSQIAKDFGICEGSLASWMKQADIEDGRRSGLTNVDRADLRGAKKRIRLLEQENEVLRRAAVYLSQANLPGRRSFPLVREMVATGVRVRVPVAVACRVTTAWYYKWLKDPVSRRR